MSILFDAWRRARGEDSEVSRALGAPPLQSARHGSALPWILCGMLLVAVAGLGAYLWRTHMGAVPAAMARPDTDAGPRQSPATGAAQHAPDSSAHGPEKGIGAADAVPAGGSNSAGRAAPGANGAADAVRPQTDEEHAAAAAPAPEGVPDDVRAALPPLTVTVHVWNPDPGSRFVVVGGRIYHEGDELGSGMTLVSITRGGEVVRFRGYLITLGP